MGDVPKRIDRTLRIPASSLWLSIGFVSAIYVFGALAGAVLAGAPGHTSPVWPAAGLALAAIVAGGMRCWPGVWLGAFVFELWADTPAMSVALASLYATGATLQALLGARLASRFVDPTAPLVRHWTLWRVLLLAGPFACLVAATIGIAAAYGFGRIEPAEVLDQWLVWWGGDTVGVLLFAPLALLLWPSAIRPVLKHRASVALPLIITAVLLVAGNFGLVRLEHAKAQRTADRLKDEVHELGFFPLAAAVGSLASIERLFAANEDVTRRQLSVFTARILAQPGLLALAWLPKLDAPDRARFERALREEGFADFRITEQAPHGQLRYAGAREFYFPGQFVEPLTPNRAIVGLDFASYPARRAAMERAADSGDVIATEPLPLVYNGRVGVPVFVPVYRQELIEGEGATSVEARRAALRGFVSGSFDLQQLFVPLADAARTRGLDFRVSDVTAGEPGIILMDSLAPGAALSWSRDLLFAGRLWRLQLQQSPQFGSPGVSEEARAYLGFSVLAAFLSALLVIAMASRNAAIEVLVTERTAELERELVARRVAERALEESEKDLDTTLQSIGDAVMATDAEGRVTRLNRIGERLTGWPLAEARGRPVSEVFRIINEETRLPAEIPVDEVLRTGEVHGLANHTVLIARDGREYAIADSAAPIVDGTGTLRGVVLAFRDVTDERRAELTLAASEARYRQFIELSPLGVFVQCDGCLQFLNAKAASLLGVDTPDAVIGRRVLEFVHPESRGLVGERIRSLNTLREPAPPAVERLLRADGATFYAEVTAVPYDHEGRAGALVLFQDITARREAEAERDRFFNLSLDMLCIAGSDGFFKRINPAFERVLGWNKEEINARPFIELVHPDDVAATVEVMERLAANQTVESFENRYRSKDGNWHWLSWKALPQPEGMIFATAHDATEQHEAAQRLSQMNWELELRVGAHVAALEALNAKEEEIRAVVDHLLECVIRIDAQGVVHSVNPAVERVFGYRPAEVVGHNVSMLMPEPHHSQHDQYLHRYRMTGQAHIIGIGREVEGRHKDGRCIPMELSVAEYEVRGERAYIGTIRDISESKRLIAELTTARVDAEQASRAKSAFLATMSHEIRTPMNGVIGMVDVLANSRLSEHQKDLVGTIRESAAALLGIIDDILDFSKIEAGKLEIERAPLSISDLVEGLCNSLVPVAARRGVDLTLFISPEIPEHVLADDVRLRQVLYNLVGNAIKFSAGRPDTRGRVSVRVEPVESWPLRLAIRVTDNGIGMAPETLGTLFTPFSQAEVSTTRRFGGTGLGLAICRRLVDLMNGQIIVESAPGAGSTFIVTLPFELATDQPQRILSDLTTVACVLVESTELHVSDLRTYLEHAGARVSVVANEAEALRIATSLPGPVVVLTYGDHRRSSARQLVTDIPAVRYVQITRGRRRRARVAGPATVVLDGDALRRHALLHAVAVAAGRASPEIGTDQTAGSFDEDVQAPSVAEARAGGRLILVAEDDEINQKVILQQLSLLGYAAEVAFTGAEALRMWRTGGYALLLTDLHMPEMDGYALAEAIRREEAGGQRIPILALTANALRGEANRARAIGMDEYLTKPIRLHVLRGALEKWFPLTKSASVATPSGIHDLPERPAVLVNEAMLRDFVGDDPATIDAILEDYLKSARQAAAQIHAAFADGDLAGVSAIAHKLKSSSRAIGAVALGDLCAELENAARAEDRETIAQRMTHFGHSMGAVLLEVAKLVEKNKP